MPNLQRTLILVAATILPALPLHGQDVTATHQRTQELRPNAYREIMLGFVGPDLRQWQQRQIEGRDCIVSPAIGDAGWEINHHRLAVDYVGSGTVEVAVAWHAADNLDGALAQRHLYSQFRQVPPLEETRLSSPYRGQTYAWIIVHPRGDVRNLQVRYIAWQGRDTLYGHVAGSFEHAGGQLPYRLMYPRNYDPSRRYPLVISGSGSGGVGNDNVRSMEMVILARFLFTDYWFEPRLEAFSLVPQIPAYRGVPEGFHPRGPAGAPVPVYHEHLPTTNPGGWWNQATLALVRSLIENPDVSVDPNRIYVSGFSLGGKAVFDLLKADPEMFAGAAAGAGWAIGVPYTTPGENLLQRLREEVQVYKHVPIYQFVGQEDRMLPQARALHEVLTAAGGQSRLFEIPGADHVSSAGHGWLHREGIDWLFQQVRRRPAQAATPRSPAAAAGENR